MSRLDLVKSVEDFLTATSNECYQPGEKPDTARSNLLNQLKLEKSQLEHGLNAITAGYQEAVKQVISFVKGV